jgi:hypothetical protein
MFDSSFKGSAYAICDSKTRIKIDGQDTKSQSFQNSTHFQRKSKKCKKHCLCGFSFVFVDERGYRIDLRDKLIQLNGTLIIINESQH